MKKIVEIVDGQGPESLLGERVLLMCGNYFYEGILSGVNDDCVELREPAIVYETGQWTQGNYADRQPLHTDRWYVSTAAIESFGPSKKG